MVIFNSYVSHYQRVFPAVFCSTAQGGLTRSESIVSRSLSRQQVTGTSQSQVVRRFCIEAHWAAFGRPSRHFIHFMCENLWKRVKTCEKYQHLNLVFTSFIIFHMITVTTCRLMLVYVVTCRKTATAFAARLGLASVGNTDFHEVIPYGLQTQ